MDQPAAGTSVKRVGAKPDHAEQAAGDEGGISAVNSLAGVRNQEIGLPQCLRQRS